MASLATGEGTAGGGTAGEGTAGFVARCVASGSAGRICRRDLVTFFSCAAEAFGTGRCRGGRSPDETAHARTQGRPTRGVFSRGLADYLHAVFRATRGT